MVSKVADNWTSPIAPVIKYVKCANFIFDSNEKLNAATQYGAGNTRRFIRGLFHFKTVYTFLYWSPIQFDSNDDQWKYLQVTALRHKATGCTFILADDATGRVEFPLRNTILSLAAVLRSLGRTQLLLQHAHTAHVNSQPCTNVPSPRLVSLMIKTFK